MLSKGLILILLLFFPSLSFASVAGDVNKANGLYSQEKYDDSIGLYEKALDQNNNASVVKYDLGTALYKKGDYEKALDYLRQASQDAKLKTRAEYNLGNGLYKLGKSKATTNIDDAIKNMKEAVGQYDDVIKQNPQDQDAQFNEDFVKKEIQRLKELKRQQQQSQQNQNQQNQNKQQNQQSQQGSQGQQQQQQAQANQQLNQHEEKSGQAKQEKQQQAALPKQDQKQKPQPQSKQAVGQQAKQKKGSAGESEVNQKDIDRKGAEDLLEDYQENEEPKKLLNYMPQKIDNRPVVKDW